MDRELIQKFKNLVRDEGGKVLCPNTAGLPEYLVILPGGHIGFITFTDSRDTRRIILRMREMGCAACLIEGEDDLFNALVYILTDAGKDVSWIAYQKECAAWKCRIEKGGDAT